MTELSVEDVTELRKQGDFRAYLRQMAGRGIDAPAVPPPLVAVSAPAYRITHSGGWPLGTAATGPTPPPDRCTCAKCGGNPAARPHQHQEGEAA